MQGSVMSSTQTTDSLVTYRAVRRRVGGHYISVEMTAEQVRARYLASQSKYNMSRKGKARYKRYDDKHPGRKENRWEPARNELRRNHVNG